MQLRISKSWIRVQLRIRASKVFEEFDLAALPLSETSPPPLSPSAQAGDREDGDGGDHACDQSSEATWAIPHLPTSHLLGTGASVSLTFNQGGPRLNASAHKPCSQWPAGSWKIRHWEINHPIFPILPSSHQGRSHIITPTIVPSRQDSCHRLQHPSFTPMEAGIMSSHSPSHPVSQKCCHPRW